MSRKNQQITFIELIYLILNKKIFILKSLIFSSLIALCLIYFIPRKYESKLLFTLINENDNSSSISTSFEDIASIAGISMNENNSGILTPYHYTQLFNDVLFKKEILDINLNDSLTLNDYLIKESDDNSNFYSHNYIDPMFILDKNESYKFKLLDKILSIEINDRNKTFLIKSSLENPFYSYILTKKSYEILQKKIIDINIKSSREILNYRIKIYNDKKKEFLILQDKLAEFKDKNQAISSSKFRKEEFTLQNEFNIINSVYTDLAKQVENSKIQVTKDTPVFNIIINPTVSFENYFPNHIYILIICLFAGLSLSIFYILFLNNFFSIFFNKLLN